MIAAIPSPDSGVWHLGPLPLRGYALAIIVGIVAALWIGERRWVARGGGSGAVADVALWAVPFGIVGGRLYHVITTPQPYFGTGGDPIDALRIWNGGLGIWGAVAFGTLGGWLGCRQRGINWVPFADAVIPGVAVAQAIGRWGNWFNQELFGRPTGLPWGLEIDLAHRPVQYATSETFHPIFLYESLACLVVAGLCVWADRRYRLGHGEVFALYVVGYTAGRFVWEMMRSDPANEWLGWRVNSWVALVLGLVAAGYFVWSRRQHRERESGPELTRIGPVPPSAPV